MFLINQLAAILLVAANTDALSNIPTSPDSVSRRQLLQTAIVGTSATILFPTEAHAEGLGAKLAKKDPAALKNSIFNVPPAAQVYPDWMKGSWKVTSSFRGYMFPSEKIPKATLTKDVTIPGFQKCSIAATCDVGLENVPWELTVLEDGSEDRKATLASQIDGYLGYKAVTEVIYDAKANPNRLSVDFVDYKTINAERIELFCNARESEQFVRDDGAKIFVCSEFVRQVTFGGGSEIGVPRQVVGNYANFWTWKYGDDGKITGNLLTAAYIDPQDALFFDEPSKPVAIYSHNLSAEKI